MAEYSVYCHTDPYGKKYFGISQDCIRRWSKGKGYIKNKRFYDAITEYGWDCFSHDILKEGLTLDEANKLEKDLVEEYSTTDPLFGYNLRGGGSGSGIVSEETRRKQSEKQKGNKNSLGRKLSEETKKKISESLKAYYSVHPNHFYGKKHSTQTINKLRTRVVSEEARRKMRENHVRLYGKNNPSSRAVVQLDLDGNVIQEYECATFAAMSLKCDLSSIIKCCRGKQKTCSGFKWEYAKAETEDDDEKI